MVNRMARCYGRYSPPEKPKIFARAKKFNTNAATSRHNSSLNARDHAMAKPMAFISAESVFACSGVSSISGGRTRDHSGSFR